MCRLSHRFYKLAGDSQIWKSAYYTRFVRPRASRIPGIRDQNISTSSLLYSSRASKWLEDEHLVRKGSETDWKKQYKLRHNWSRGSCGVREVRIAERPSVPPMLVRLHEDIVITADATHGLRAWLMKGVQRLVAVLDLKTSTQGSRVPSSMALDSSSSGSNTLNITVGFCDGRFGVYALDRLTERLICQYIHAPSSNGIISAIAFALPYLVTMTEAQLLSLYAFPTEQPAEPGNGGLEPPRLLSSLKSQTAWPPLSLSIRSSARTIITSIAYALPTYLSGWSVGLQELRLSLDGTIKLSRLTSAANHGFTPLSRSSSGTSSPLSDLENAHLGDSESRLIPSLKKPTSLSYSHPYLLASHPDNTLTLYLVQSTEADLVIGNGSRLWGHTSSVSGAHVGDRGKAVSVSAHGNEIRVWELEGGISSGSVKRRAVTGEVSVQVRPETRATKTGNERLSALALGTASMDMDRWTRDLGYLSTSKGWVDFDEERVIVLRESALGSQVLVVYDFS